MRDLFTDPLCEKSDLGAPIPDSPHAVSVCLPCWEHVIGYEEGDQKVIDEMETGYPRFVTHPDVAELFLAARDEFCKPDGREMAMVLPSLGAAWRGADFVKAKTGASCRMESYGWENLTALIFPDESFDAAWKFWQHSGEIVSSRLANAALTDSPVDPEILAAGDQAGDIIRDRVAEHLGENASAKRVFLFSCGMGAISAIHRSLLKLRAGLPTAQIEFPYLDLMKVQEEFNPAGVIDISLTGNSGGVSQLESALSEHESLAGVFTEIPSNPLLRTADLAEISQRLRERGIPLVIDDTIATSVNVDSFQFADIVTTSLTKSFSGVGDVMAGAVSVRADSPFAAEFCEMLADEEAANPLFALDALVLEANSRHYVERVTATNENAEEVFDFLSGHPLVEQVWFPKSETPEFYEAALKSGGGYSGLISFLLKDAAKTAPPFYDALRVSKGPSLGTNYSLACPYTLLAHYPELDWAADRGVDRNLIRTWIGVEEPGDLVDRFEEALAAIR
ncbi:MAG: PLP-dependent transferase [Verrucomicrobiales bacterium]|nr:PLP-dependent transferase [Verrucomicrobiales bacterium]